MAPDGESGDSLPADRERVDSFNIDGKTLDLQLQHVTLRNKLSIWVFSSDSVASIPRLAQMTSDSPVERYLPTPLVQWSFLDTSLWRWIALAVLAVLVAALSRLLRPSGCCVLLKPVLKRIWRQADWSELDGFRCAAATAAGCGSVSRGNDLDRSFARRVRPYSRSRSLAAVLSGARLAVHASGGCDHPPSERLPCGRSINRFPIRCCRSRREF